MRYLDRFFEPEHWQQDSFTNQDGKKIRYGHVSPPGEKKGTVIITTGYADFIESYHETIHDYLDRGFEVWMMDWAGQGGSDKKRSDDEKAQLMQDHVRDLYKFRHDIVKIDEEKPVFLSTHSMGGQVALHYLHEHEGDFDFAVMASPLVDLRLKGVARSFLKGIFKSAVNIGLGDTPIRDGRKTIMRQASAQRRNLRKEDPVRMDLHKTFFYMNKQLRAEDPTFGLVDSLFEATDKLNEEKTLKSIKTPILLGMAGEEDIVDNDAIRRAAQFLPNNKLVEIEGATHSIWHERQKYRQAWWTEVDRFVDAQLQDLSLRKDNVNDNKRQPKIPPQPKGPSHT